MSVNTYLVMCANDVDSALILHLTTSEQAAATYTAFNKLSHNTVVWVVPMSEAEVFKVQPTVLRVGLPKE